MLSHHSRRLALLLLCTVATDKISANPSNSGLFHSKSVVFKAKDAKFDSEGNPVLLSSLQNFTFYAMNMAFACPRVKTLTTQPHRICMNEGKGDERRHLGPTLQDLRVQTPGAAQYLTTQFDAKSLIWRNSVEKRGKHLGPTLDEIAQMKREQQLKPKVPANHKQVPDNEDGNDDGNSPTKADATSLIRELRETTQGILFSTRSPADQARAEEALGVVAQYSPAAAAPPPAAPAAPAPAEPVSPRQHVQSAVQGINLIRRA